jgi:transposase-like protein
MLENVISLYRYKYETRFLEPPDRSTGSYWRAAVRAGGAVHFMHNTLVNVLHHAKEIFASELKEIWAASTEEEVRRRTGRLAEHYEGRFPKAIRILEEGIDDPPVFYRLVTL